MARSSLHHFSFTWSFQFCQQRPCLLFVLFDLPLLPLTPPTLQSTQSLPAHDFHPSLSDFNEETLVTPPPRRRYVAVRESKHYLLQKYAEQKASRSVKMNHLLLLSHLLQIQYLDKVIEVHMNIISTNPYQVVQLLVCFPTSSLALL